MTSIPRMPSEVEDPVELSIAFAAGCFGPPF